MMWNDNFREIAAGSLIALVVLLGFSIWTEIAPESLGKLSYEDGVIEYITAILFGISAICFACSTRVCSYLKSKPLRFSIFTLGWSLFAFLIMGEEISWGQRLFGFSTPEAVIKLNHQGVLVNLNRTLSLESSHNE